MKLVTLDFTRLHHAEFGQMITRLSDDFAKSGINIDTDDDFKKLFSALKTKNQSFSKALEQIRENENTQKIAELDGVRDDDFKALRDSIKPYRNSKREHQKEAYNALKIVFDEYKNITELNYEAETKKIATLLSVLKTEQYPFHISNLQIQGFVDDLEKSNTAFDTLFAVRSMQNIAKETYDTKALRREMSEIYRKLVTYIETLASVKQDPFYPNALEIINNSRKYFADLLAKRQGVNKEKKKTEEKKDKED